jgi:hypothetical protein
MLKVVFTGSSLLQILNARADLSRHATYTMQGLSFREYLSIETGQHFDKLTLESILSNHSKESALITVKPLYYFFDISKQGTTLYKEELDLYVPRLEEVNMMLEIELPLLRGLDLAYVHKINNCCLLFPNRYLLSLMSKLSTKLVMRSTLLCIFIIWMKLVYYQLV